MIKNFKRIIAMLLIIFNLLPTGLISIFASNIGDNVYLQRGDLSFYTVQYWNTDKNAWYYLICNTVWYIDKDGTRRVAYCVDPNTPGIGYVTNIEGYSADITSYFRDEKIWRIFRNGYPYVSKESLGVETEDDAYLATKQAVYSIIAGRTLAQIRTHYRAGQTAIAGQDVNEIRRRGQKVVDAIYHLVDIAYNGTQKPQYDDLVKINKTGNFLVDSNKNYYSQKYTVISQTKMLSYKVKEISGFPNGTYVADLNGNKKTTFNSDESFKIMVPKNSITSNYTGKIIVEGNVQNYPVFYAINKDGYQTHAVINDSYSNAETQTSLNINGLTSGIKIVKTDSDTNEKIPNITFNLKYEDGTNIKNITTNSKGEATLTGLKQGKIIITEVSTNENYVLNSTPIKVNLNYNETTSINLTSTHKKGNLKLTLVDKEQDICLNNSEFDFIDNKGNIVKHIITNKQGIAQIENVNIGTYTIRQTKAEEGYKLSLEKNVTIKYNETTEIRIENEKKKGQIKIVETDEENSKKIEGIEIQIIDKDNNIVETILTNEKGEALTSSLPIGEYNVKELQSNENYILEKEAKIAVEEENVKLVEFKSKHKRGNLSIQKLDIDDGKTPVENVKLKITDKDGNIYNAITDETGIAYVENIRIGIITIEEIETNEIYKKEEIKINAEIKWNEVSDVTLKSEKLKGQIKICEKDEENMQAIKETQYEIINLNNEIVETVTTNEEGEAITNKLPIGKYKIKQIKTDKKHITNDEIGVEVLTNKISEVDVKSKRIKGQIKIKLIENEEEKLQEAKIPNVEYEVYDINGKIVSKIITNKEGIGTTQLLDKGVYFIREAKNAEGYIKNEREFIAIIADNEKVVELNIQIKQIENEENEEEIEKDKISETNKDEIDEVKNNEMTKNENVQDFNTNNSKNESKKIVKARKLPRTGF